MCRFIIFFIVSIALNSCYQDGKSKNDSKLSDNKVEIDKLIDTLKNQIDIQNFLDSLTNQDEIKIIDSLTEKWDDKQNCYLYDGNNYHFKSTFQDKKINGEILVNSIFHDGEHKIDFSKHEILGENDSLFEIEKYGFQNQNSLQNVKIIQIGQFKFLYADISFWCNGIGCNCKINMIYDLKTHHAFFIENYHFPYDHYFISDFDKDQIPDLLVISKNKNFKKFGQSGTEFKANWYTYENEKFKLTRDSKLSPYFYQFYRICSENDEFNCSEFIVHKKNWR